MADGFWDVIRAQLNELRRARTADDVVRILSKERNPYRLDNPEWNNAAGDGFFAGSGGDDTVQDALFDAGWLPVWMEASYYWVMRAPHGSDGSVITYIEGDIYKGDHR